MKQIYINSNCDGCGLCIIKSEYIEENEDGNAEPVRGKQIDESHILQLEQLCRECPRNAIELKNAGVATKAGMEGLKEIISDLNAKCTNLTVMTPARDTYRFRVKDCYLEAPGCGGEWRYEYSSERQAESAAEDEFRSRCFSQNVANPMVKKIFAEYKVSKLKPYYNSEDVKESYYYQYNEQIRSYLANAYTEICSLHLEKKLPDNWSEFSVYIPASRCSYIEWLKNFDEMSQEYDVVSMIDKSYRKFTSSAMDHYMLSFDFDSTEEIVGTGRGGKLKYKDKWNFSGFRDASREFVNDLYDEVEGIADAVEDRAEGYIKEACMEYQKKLKERFHEKIEVLEKIVNGKDYGFNRERLNDEHIIGSDIVDIASSLIRFPKE